MVAPFSLGKKGSISDHEGIDALVRPSYDQNLFRRPNVALCTLASLIDENIEFDYLDEQYTPIDTSKAYDIVAISTVTVNAYRAYELAKEFRQTGAYVIIGGIHASLVPMEVANHADSVVVGEGENAWVEFLEDFKNGRTRKIYQGGNIDLNDSPPPRYNFLPNEAFYTPLFKKDVFTYQFSRGCPNDCSFCASSKVYGKKYRLKSIDKYIREMRVGLERTDNHMHLFADDNPFVNLPLSTELLEEIKKMHTVWIGATDIAVAENTKLLKLIRESGCYSLMIGFESLSFSNLQEVDPFKAKLLACYDEYVKRIHDHGINIGASFVIGLDHDPLDVSERIYEFAVKHKIFLCATTILIPYPGTRIYYQLKNENRLLYENYWNKCTGMDVLFEPKNTSKEELLKSYYDLITKESNRGTAERNFFIPENLYQGPDLSKTTPSAVDIASEFF